MPSGSEPKALASPGCRGCSPEREFLCKVLGEMRKSLAESEREELLAELTEAHNVVSKVLSELRSRYSVKSPTMKAAIKAEWAVFHLKRELLKMDGEKTPPRTPLPKVQRGGEVVDVEEL